MDFYSHGKRPLSPDEPSPQPQSKRMRFTSPPPSPSLFDPSSYYKLTARGTRAWRNGPINETSFKLDITKALDASDPADQQLQLKQILDHAFLQIVSTAPPDCRAQVYAVNPRLMKKCMSTRRLKPKELTFDKLASDLMVALQSDQYLELHETEFILCTYCLNTEIGWVSPNLRSRLEHNMHVWANSKMSLDNPTSKYNKIPKNFQQACISLAISKGIYHLNNKGASIKQLKSYGRSKSCRNYALELMKTAQLTPTHGPVDSHNLGQLETALPPGVGVNFYDDVGVPYLSIGTHSKDDINIFIAYDQDSEAGTPAYHAYRITSMQAFLGVRGHCSLCFKSLHHPEKGHRCRASSCKLCLQQDCSNTEKVRPLEPYKICDDCNFIYNTEKCFDAHLSYCLKRKRCEVCNESADAKVEHKCGRPKCSICLQNHLPFDHCYVQKAKLSNKPSRWRSIWYGDCETYTVGEKKDHIANLIVLERELADGAIERQEYTGYDAMKKFVKDCMRKDSQFSHSLVVWHNASNFDGHLWYRELVDATAPPKDLIVKGQSIISMRMRQNNVVLRDFLQFVPNTPLSALPKMFDVPSGPKGCFPYLLNTPDWVKFGKHIVYQEEIDGIMHRFPPLHYFSPGTRRQKDFEELKSWHEDQCKLFSANPALQYIPEDELISYCGQDVTILRMAATKYRNTWLEQYPGLEPFDSLTFPSYNNKLFRTYYMEENSICMLPPEGFCHKNRQFSISALAWTSHMQRILGLTAYRTARHGYEVKIGGHYVDATGVDNAGMRHVFNFHGCKWHGCPCRQKDRKPAMDIYLKRTQQTDEHLSHLGTNPTSPYGLFTYHTIWECEFIQNCKENHELNSFVTNYKRQWTTPCATPLKPREALKGGRTNAISHRLPQVDIQNGWKLHYLDFTSLYPSINFGMNNEMWPVGPPTVFIGTDFDLAPPQQEWFGLVKLKIVPPPHLLHPVLPETVGEKLCFHLCSTCAHLNRGTFCNHDDEERAIVGTYFTGEVNLALEKGYKIQEMYELYHWPSEQQSQNIFRGLIKDQYSKKALSSAVPSDPIKFQQLLDEYRTSMDLELLPEQFCENKALRSLAKISLNSIWGFLGKKNNPLNTEFTKSHARYLEIENDPKLELEGARVLPDQDWVMLTYKTVEETASRSGSIILACLTTAYARMRLYSLIDAYSDHVWYFDTDSILLYLPPTVTPPPTSTVLGGLKDEIYEEYGEGAHITSFYSTGPKSYSFTVERDGKVLKKELKVKGIRQSVDAQSVISVSTLPNLVNNRELEYKVPQFSIRREMNKSRLFSLEYEKRVSFQSNKRWFPPEPNPSLRTLPFGYKSL